MFSKNDMPWLMSQPHDISWIPASSCKKAGPSPAGTEVKAATRSHDVLSEVPHINNTVPELLPVPSHR